jgi:SNF family Na+-dependent transporter
MHKFKTTIDKENWIYIFTFSIHAFSGIVLNMGIRQGIKQGTKSH